MLYFQVRKARPNEANKLTQNPAIAVLCADISHLKCAINKFESFAYIVRNRGVILFFNNTNYLSQPLGAVETLYFLG